MPQRVFNFSAGPGTLPLEVLEASARALIDFQGKGFGIAECSHRGKEFEGVLTESIAKCRSILGLADTHDVIYVQGGATAVFSMLPMNFLRGSADYVVAGEWSKKAADAGKKLGNVRVVASSEASNFDHTPDAATWQLNTDADYLHVCSNETVHGHRLPAWPTHANLVVDASSEFMSRPHPVNDCAMVYAGAQKNLGPSGVVLLVVRKDWYAKQKDVPVKLWSLKDLAANNSMINTPPTFGVYVLLEMFRWIEKQGGLKTIEQTNARKAKHLYDAIDNSGGFYAGTIAEKAQRSHMNVTFRLPGEDVTERFIKEAAGKAMVALKGYRTVGGIRASIYNAMPEEGCRQLASFMTDFAKANG
jgi:phosphoserine aminotransferase